jgi:hypothetical protein
VSGRTFRRDVALLEFSFLLQIFFRCLTVMDVQGNLAGDFECTM